MRGWGMGTINGSGSRYRGRGRAKDEPCQEKASQQEYYMNPRTLKIRMNALPTEFLFEPSEPFEKMQHG